MSHENALATDSIGERWNRFWFAPSDPLNLCVLRIVVGVFALTYHLSFTSDLVHWFGRDGLMPREMVEQVSGPEGLSFRPSLLNIADDRGFLWTIHFAGIAVLSAFTFGLVTRASGVLALVFVLSYVHRAPMISGELEPVLTMLLAYLCLTPCGNDYSLDRLLARRGIRLPSVLTAMLAPAALGSTASTVGLRLIQLHLAGLYLSMALTKLAGDTWWGGEAVWWLMARSESRLVDFSSLSSYTMLINGWSHLIVFLELAFPVAVWNRQLRPWLFALLSVSWLLLALLTGLVAYCLLMVVANLAFVDSAQLRRWLPGRAESSAHEPAWGPTSAAGTGSERPRLGTG